MRVAILRPRARADTTTSPKKEPQTGEGVWPFCGHTPDRQRRFRGRGRTGWAGRAAILRPRDRPPRTDPSSSLRGLSEAATAAGATAKPERATRADATADAADGRGAHGRTARRRRRVSEDWRGQVRGIKMGLVRRRGGGRAWEGMATRRRTQKRTRRNPKGFLGAQCAHTPHGRAGDRQLG